MTTPIHDAIRALGHEEFAIGRDRLIAIVDQNPGWADAWALLSGAHLALAEVELASAASERAIALAPDAFLPRMKAGELALRLGQIEVAESQFLAAIRATEIDTADAVAARRGLAVARRASRLGIAHRAALPRLAWPVRRAAGVSRLGASLVGRIRRSAAAREAI